MPNNLHAKRTLFASGGEAKVFRKSTEEMNKTGPRSSNLVRVFRTHHNPPLDYYANTDPRRRYYDHKIIDILFPGHVSLFKLLIKPNPRAKNYYYELHSTEVPLNKELEDYNEMRRRTGAITQSFYSPEYKAHKKEVSSNSEVQRLKQAMRELGISAGLENATNVSVANPEKPVFFEAFIDEPNKLLTKLDSIPYLTPPQKNRIRKLLKLGKNELQQKRQK